MFTCSNVLLSYTKLHYPNIGLPDFSLLNSVAFIAKIKKIVCCNTPSLLIFSVTFCTKECSNSFIFGQNV